MKHIQKFNNITHIGIIVVFLAFMCQHTYAQYGYPPRMHVSPYPRVVVPVPYTPGYRQAYNPYRPVAAPPLSFGMHFDPLISWFSTYSYDSRNDGVVPGFNFGVSYNRHFSPNYSFSSGISIINAGGRLISSDITYFELKNYDRVIFTVEPGQAITYKITYLSVPLGLKLQTNQMGYGRFFTDFGFDPKIVVAGRADIPSLNIRGGNALPELNTFNLSFHIMAGMEYPLAGSNNFIFGIGFDSNLFDVTRDNGNQPSDVVFQKSVSFRIGITF